MHENSMAAWRRLNASHAFTENRRKVAEYIAENPGKTAVEISEALRHGVRGVATAIFALHKSKVIIGCANRPDSRTGYTAEAWMINTATTPENFIPYKDPRDTVSLKLTRQELDDLIAHRINYEAVLEYDLDSELLEKMKKLQKKKRWSA